MSRLGSNATSLLISLIGHDHVEKPSHSVSKRDTKACRSLETAREFQCVTEGRRLPELPIFQNI